ncbi:unnamed protein product [Rhizopus stolonifer]
MFLLLFILVLDNSSLGVLTRHFIDLISANESGELNLNFAAEKLKAQKRRLYDITNVLEGVNILEKCSKNHVKWARNKQENRDLTRRLESLRNQNRDLEKEYGRLNDIRQKVDFEIEQDMKTPNCYLTFQDLVNYKQNTENTLLVVTTPYNQPLDEKNPIKTKGYICLPGHSNQPLRVSLTQDSLVNESYSL